MTIHLRPATAEDAEEIAVVYLNSRKKFLPFASLAHSDDEVRGWIRDTLIPSGSVTVAEDEKRIVGMMATSTFNGTSWIDHLYLSPDFVGHGIGKRMLRAAMDILAPPIRLYTFQQNTAARRFYERHSFHPISWTDGADNEEKCPDILYEFSNKREEPNRAEP